MHMQAEKLIFGVENVFFRGETAFVVDYIHPYLSAFFPISSRRHLQVPSNCVYLSFSVGSKIPLLGKS